jgi:hypothetical protein
VVFSFELFKRKNTKNMSDEYELFIAVKFVICVKSWCNCWNICCYFLSYYLTKEKTHFETYNLNRVKSYNIYSYLENIFVFKSLVKEDPLYCCYYGFVNNNFIVRFLIKKILLCCTNKKINIALFHTYTLK